MSKWHRVATCIAAALTFVAASGRAEAGENGENSVVLGVETAFNGRSPPPGWYLSAFSQLYLAHQSERNGVAVPDFRLILFVQGARLQHVWSAKLFDHQLSTDMLLSVTHADIRIAGRSDRQTGLGDIQFVPLRLSKRFEHFAYGISTKIVTPTGLYRTEPTAITSPGTNHWAIAPTVGLTYFTQTVDVGASISYVFNTKNPFAHYVNGQELQADYVAEGKWFDAFWAGACGYFYQQTTDDVSHEPGAIGDSGNRGRVLGIGAQLRRDFGFGSLNVKWIHEVLVENRAQGDRFFVQMFLPL